MYIHREIETELMPFLHKKEVIAIIGARQTGKTTLLKYLLTLFEEKNKSVKYITFESPNNLELFNNIEDFIELNKNYQIIIIDEFQYAKDGGKKLKYLYDTTDIKIIISGSSSLEIVFNTAKYMVGRMFNFILWPFSFREYLLYKEQELHSALTERIPEINFPDTKVTSAFGDAINNRIEKHFHEYLIYGGYPAVVLTEEKNEKPKVLESIFENYLLRDIRNLLELATEQELIKLIRFLSAQTANLIDYNELCNISGIYYKKLLSHLEILRQTYIIDLIQPFFSNKRTEMIKNPKVYFIDNGFRNYVISDFRNPLARNDMGMLAENYVFMYLKRKTGAFNPLNFWRTKSKAEIDFIFQTQDQIIPIEVKYTRKTTLGKSFYSFIENYMPSYGYILTKNFFKKENINKCKVTFIPAYYL